MAFQRDPTALIRDPRDVRHFLTDVQKNPIQFLRHPVDAPMVSLMILTTILTTLIACLRSSMDFLRNPMGFLGSLG
eukprot:3205792-Pyramimonas_sp.AAC.1